MTSACDQSLNIKINKTKHGQGHGLCTVTNNIWSILIVLVSIFVKT